MNIPKFRLSWVVPWLGIFALAAIVGMSAQLSNVRSTSAQEVEGFVTIEKFVTTDDGDCDDVSTDDCVMEPGDTGFFRIHVHNGLPFFTIPIFESSLYDNMPDGFLTGLVMVPDADGPYNSADWWSCTDVPGTNDVQCNIGDDQDFFCETADEEICAEFDVIIFFTAPSDVCGDVEYTNSASVTTREFADSDLVGFGTDMLTVTVSGDPCPTETPTETPTESPTGEPSATPPGGGTGGTGSGTNNNNNNNNTNDNNNNNSNNNDNNNSNNNSNNNTNNINIVIS